MQENAVPTNFYVSHPWENELSDKSANIWNNLHAEKEVHQENTQGTQDFCMARFSKRYAWSQNLFSGQLTHARPMNQSRFSQFYERKTLEENNFIMSFSFESDPPWKDCFQNNLLAQCTTP